MAKVNTVYSKIPRRAKEIYLQSLVSPRISYLNDKNGNVILNRSAFYEKLFVNILNLHFGNLFEAKHYGNKNICFDVLINDKNTSETIALQIKSTNLGHKYIKIYEQCCAVSVVDGLTNPKEIVKALVEISNKRLEREKDIYKFNRLETLFLVKGPEVILTYDNPILVDVFELSEITDERVVTEINSQSKEVTKIATFNYRDKNYKFTLSNHTLSIEFLATKEMDMHISASHLKTETAVINEVIDETIKNLDTSLFNGPLPSTVDFEVTRNSYLIGQISFGEYTKVMVDSAENLIYDEDDVVCLPKTNVNIVEQRENDKSYIFMLKDSMIEKSSTLYKELLGIGAVDKKGTIIKNVRFKDKKELRSFLK